MKDSKRYNCEPTSRNVVFSVDRFGKNNKKTCLTYLTETYYPKSPIRVKCLRCEYNSNRKFEISKRENERKPIIFLNI